MRSLETLRHWTFLALTMCFSLGVGSNQQQARSYQNLINHVRSLLSHPYRDTTAVMTGARTVSYVALDALTGNATRVDLILSHRDLYVLGYRLRNGRRVVHLFADSDSGILDRNDYDDIQRLRFGGSYTELERYAGHSRQRVKVNSYTLGDNIRDHLENPTENTTGQERAEIMLVLVMTVAEASRFREISGAVQQALHNGDTWHATNRDTALMNSWDDLSTFVVQVSDSLGTCDSQWFPSLGQEVTLRDALVMLAILSRCFQRPSRPRRQTTAAECAVGPGIDAALADGPNNVYLFNGPNFAYVHFTPGTTDDSILGEMKSIYQDWSFLRGTVFVKGLDAGFRVPYSSNAYIFKGETYALIDVPGQCIINGPNTIWDSCPSLRPTVFAQAINAAFASKRENEVYLFRGNNYALVNFAPGSTNDYIISGPNAIYSSWPSLQNTLFVYGLDAAFARPDSIEAYLFRSDEYVLVNYAPGTTNDYIVNGPLKIRDGWPSLRNTAFDV